VKHKFGTPWEWYKGIETCRSGYNINIVKIKVYCALLVEIKTVHKMHSTYIRISVRVIV
jgi:hypothetical protein